MKKLILLFAVALSLSLSAQKVLVKQISIDAAVYDRITKALTERHGYQDSITDTKGVRILNISKQEFVQNLVIKYLISETNTHETATAVSVAARIKQTELDSLINPVLKPVVKLELQKGGVITK